MLEDAGKILHEVLNFTLFRIGEQSITVAGLGGALLILLGTWALARVVDRALARAPQLEIFEGNAVSGFRRLARYIILIIGGIVSLETLGFDLSTLFTAGAIFAVGFGFAMQNIAQNFVSGVILIAERTVRQNDVLEVEGVVVRIVEMGLRSSVARTRDDEELVIPNTHLVQNTVKNFTLTDALYRIRSRVGVSYSSDMVHVRETLEAVGKKASFRSKRKEPRVLLMGFGSSSVDWELSVWISDPWDQPRALSRLNELVWMALMEAGITISFPQMDLHFDPGMLQALQAMRRQPLAAVVEPPAPEEEGDDDTIDQPVPPP
jgi:small-conductance mechanosensitive channel